MKTYELEYRGKALDGTWVVGSLLVAVNAVLIVEYAKCENPQYEYTRITDFHTAIVDANTVGMFTGLRDKNGTKIYEGDIISLSEEGHARPFGYVKWNPNGFFYIHTSPVFEFQDCVEIGKMTGRYPAEVIGNIHDNPELLKKE